MGLGLDLGLGLGLGLGLRRFRRFTKFRDWGVLGLGFWVQGWGAWGLGLRRFRRFNSGSGCTRFRVLGSGFRAQGLVGLVQGPKATRSLSSAHPMPPLLSPALLLTLLCTKGKVQKEFKP